MAIVVYTLSAGQTVVNLTVGSEVVNAHVSGPLIDNGQLVSFASNPSEFDYTLSDDGLTLTLENTYNTGTLLTVENVGDVVISPDSGDVPAVIDDLILYVPDPTKSRSLGFGQIYIGLPDTDPETEINQKQLYAIQESGAAIEIEQPHILSIGGTPTYNGAFVRLAVAGNYSIKILDKNGSQVYYIANVLRTNEGSSVLCYSTTSDLEAASLPVGTCVKVEELHGACFVVQPQGYVSRPGDITLGNDLVAELQDDDGYDVRWFGAKIDADSSGNGTDDSAAIQAAFSRDDGAKIRWPSSDNYCRIDQTISATDKYLHLAGAGIQATKIVWTGTGVMFSLTRTGVQSARYQISDMFITTNTVGDGTAFLVEQDQVSGVVGGYDICHGSNIIIDSETGGYWKQGFWMKNSGGLYLNQTTIRNSGDTDAQNVLGTRAIYLDNDNASIAVIRALHLTDCYLSRFYHPVRVSVLGSMESIYLDQGEIVGCQQAVYISGTEVEAIRMEGIHVDAIRSAYVCEDGVDNTVVRFVGCDLRLGTNGSDLFPGGNVIQFGDGGERITVTGTHMRTADTTGHCIDFSAGATRYAVCGNVLANCETAILLGTSSNDGIGVNDYLSVTFPFDQRDDYNRFYNGGELLKSFKDEYEGSLNLLVNDAIIENGRTFILLGSSASGGPAAEPTIGAIVETLVFDSNRKYQWFYNANGIWFRIFNGSWGAWAEK